MSPSRVAVAPPRRGKGAIAATAARVAATRWKVDLSVVQLVAVDVVTFVAAFVVTAAVDVVRAVARRSPPPPLAATTAPRGWPRHDEVNGTVAVLAVYRQRRKTKPAAAASKIVSIGPAAPRRREGRDVVVPCPSRRGRGSSGSPAIRMRCEGRRGEQGLPHG